MPDNRKYKIVIVLCIIVFGCAALFTWMHTGKGGRGDKELGYEENAVVVTDEDELQKIVDDMQNRDSSISLEYKNVAGSSDGTNFSCYAEFIAFATKDTTKKSMVTLGAGNDSATYAGYKIFGDVAAKPAKAWAATDTLNFSIVFSFEPVLAAGASN